MSQGDMQAAQAWAPHLATQPPEVIGSSLLVLAREALDGELPAAVRWAVTDLGRLNCSVPRADVLQAMEASLTADDTWSATVGLVLLETLLRRLVAQQPLSQDEAAVVRAFLASLDARGNITAPERNSLRTRLLRALPVPDTQTADTSCIAGIDGWSTEVLPAVSALGPAATAALRHLTNATGSHPTAKWLAGCKDLAGDPTYESVIKILLQALVSAIAVIGSVDSGQPDIQMVLDERNTDLARAAAWAAIPIDQPWVVPALRAAAIRGMQGDARMGWLSGDKMPNACIAALGRIASPSAISALQHLTGVTKNRGFQSRIAAALAAAASGSGLSPSQLVERSVPTLGLDEGGTISLQGAGGRAHIRLDPLLTVSVEWQGGQGWSKKAPATAAAQEVSAVKRLAKEVKDLVSSEHRRIETLLASDRSWDLAEWRQHYLDHPVTGRVARRLLWIITDGNRTVVGMPTADLQLCTTAKVVDLPTAGTVRLWHPTLATTDEVAAWRTWMLTQGFQQPFKQAFREVYIVTPAELETGMHSNRFAAHILRYQQTYALFKARGWTANYLGPHDGGYDGVARHVFADAGLTVVFAHTQTDSEAAVYIVDLCTTDRVWFHRTGDRAKVPVPIADIPPLVFSEAMRDVDLFVGVTSIALDPTWADRQRDPHFGYWATTSFGELNAAATVRREVLRSVLAKLKIADRVELGDRYVRVRGNLGTYRVHIGSGNVLIEPDDRYLCIVSGSRATKVMLPFEGDGVLAIVLSKIVLLAADDKITDASILAQLPRRA